MENEKIETTADGTKPAAATPQTAAEAQAKLMSIQITDENVALNVMVSFLNLAQRRGVFSIDESSKIWECIQKFQKH
jgi:hypothetical protein